MSQLEQQVGRLSWHYKLHPDAVRDLPMRDIKLLAESIPTEMGLS